MKKIIYFFPVLIALNVTGQVIMDETTFIRPNNYVINWLTHNDPTLILPSEGDDQSWNYPVIASNGNSTEEYVAIDNPFFSESDNCIEQSTVDFEGLELTGIYYFDVNEDGYFQTGIRANEFKEYIGDALPVGWGGPNDSIIFEETDILFEEPWQIVAFPANYESEWSDTIVWDAGFYLNIEALSFDYLPGNYRQITGVSSEVVGQGNIVLPFNDATETFHALLIKTEEFRIDSFFINGEAADQSMLDLINVTQGEVTTYYYYDFFVPNTISFPLRLYTNALYSDVIYSRFNPDLTIYSGIEKNQLEFSMYPNPVSDVLFFNVDENVTQLQIVDINGKTIFDGIPKGNQINTSNLQSGFYFLKITTPLNVVVQRFVKE
jgi:hypothetical protein